MSDTPPVITYSLTNPLLSNVPIRTVIAECQTTLPNSMWSLSEDSGKAVGIDPLSGTILSLTTPLPKLPMNLTVIATADDVEPLSITFPVPIVQMPEFRGLTLEPNTLETTDPTGTVIGTFIVDATGQIPPESITYTLTASSAALAFVVQDDTLVLQTPLVPGTYTVTIKLTSTFANQPQSFDILITINPPAEAETVQERAQSLLINPIVTVTCASDPAIDGSYSADTGHRTYINSVTISINAGTGLPSGQDTFNYLDTDAALHTWNADEFLVFSQGVMVYIYNLSLVANGFGLTLPGNVIQIP